jgi:hypothetical protein
MTALHCCAGSRLGKHSDKTAKGLLEIARMLVEAGADVHATVRSWGHDVDVAYFVIGSGQVAMLELLLGHGLDATAGVSSAAWNGREDVLDLLLAHGARLDAPLEHERTVLNELIRWGQFTQARMLLHRGASPNVPDDRGWTAMHQAVSRGNVKMLRDLVAAGGDAERRDREGMTPRELARERGRAPIASLLGA